MEPKQTRQFIKLIREHFRLRAEVITLAAILETAVRLNQPSLGWLKALKLARTEQEYQNTSEQFEPLLAELEQSAEATELDSLLDSIPPTQFLN